MAAADIIRGVSSDTSGGSVIGTTVVVTAPAGVVAGDKLSLIITLRDAMAAWTPEPGWKLVAAPEEASARVAYLYRAIYGTDVTGSSWTFTNGPADTASSKWAWSCVALKGSEVGDFLTGAAQPRDVSGTDTPTPPITVDEPAHLVGLAGDRITGGSVWTWPAGWAEQTDVATDTGTNAVSNTSAVYGTTPAPAGTYTVTPVSSTTGAIAWAGIFAYADAASGPVPAAAALSGSGSLTAGVRPGVIRTAALGGSGTLAGARGGMTARQPAALSGAGSLTTTQRIAIARAAALSGAGALTTTQRVAFTGPATLSGSGTLTAIGRPGWVKPAALSGSGTMLASVFGFAFGLLSGSGTLVTTQRASGRQGAALSGAGQLTAAGRVAAVRAALLASTGSLTVVTPAVPIDASLTGEGHLSTFNLNLLRVGGITPNTIRIGGLMPKAIYLGSVLVWRP